MVVVPDQRSRLVVDVREGVGDVVRPLSAVSRPPLMGSSIEPRRGVPAVEVRDRRARGHFLQIPALQRWSGRSSPSAGSGEGGGKVVDPFDHHGPACFRHDRRAKQDGRLPGLPVCPDGSRAKSRWNLC